MRVPYKFNTFRTFLGLVVSEMDTEILMASNLLASFCLPDATRSPGKRLKCLGIILGVPPFDDFGLECL